MPFNLSAGEVLVLLVVSVLLFGGRLPQVARTIGKTLASFKRGMNAEMGRLDFELRDQEAPPYNPAAHLRPKAPPATRAGGGESGDGAKAQDPEAGAEEPPAAP